MSTGRTLKVSVAMPPGLSDEHLERLHDLVMEDMLTLLAEGLAQICRESEQRFLWGEPTQRFEPVGLLEDKS